MEIDPLDDGPRPDNVSTVRSLGPTTILAVPTRITREDEARQAIELLRSDELSARVSAAHRLPDIAAILGPERTREVRVENARHGEMYVCGVFL